MWKRALIRPLSKTNSPHHPSDTRPIANLPVFSKLFERALYKQIYDFSVANDLLDPRQSGFRKNF